MKGRKNGILITRRLPLKYLVLPYLPQYFSLRFQHGNALYVINDCPILHQLSQRYAKETEQPWNTSNQPPLTN